MFVPPQVCGQIKNVCDALDVRLCEVVCADAQLYCKARGALALLHSMSTGSADTLGPKHELGSGHD